MKHYFDLNQKIEWSSEFAVGIQEIDKQHYELFREINDLISSKDKQNKVKEIIEFIEKYVIEHFHHEEVLMQKTGFPEYTYHKDMHNKFIKTFKQIKNDYFSNGISNNLAFRLQSRLIEWLLNHVLKSDKKIGKWLNEGII